MSRTVTKKKKKKKKKAPLQFSSSVGLDEQPLKGPEKGLARRIFVHRVMKKWSIAHIAQELDMEEEDVAAEFKTYAKRLALFHDPRKVELEVEFCEDQIRVLLRALQDIQDKEPENRIDLTPQIVQLSKAVYLWEELLCKLRGYLLPSSVMQQIIEERQKQLANLEQLSAESQKQIFEVLKKERKALDKTAPRFGGFSIRDN